VSQNTDDRAIIRAVDAKLAAHGCLTPEEVREQIGHLQRIAVDPEADFRTRQMAAKFLIDHDWDVYVYEKPPVQKVDLTSGGDKITGFEVVFINKTDTTAVTRPPTDGAPQ